MALKNDSETLTKELKAALKQGRNFVLSLGAKPQDGFLALSKKKIPQSETKAAKEKTKKKVFRGSCFKEGSTFVFETPLAVTPAMKTKLKQMIKETTAFKVGKFELRTNPEWAECDYEDEATAGDGGGKGGSGSGGAGGGGATAVEEPPTDDEAGDSADAAPAGGASADTTATSTPDTGESPAAPAGAADPSAGAAAPSAPEEDVNPFSGEASAATTAATVDDVKGKTPEQALKALRKKIDELRSWGDRSASKLKKDAKEIEELIAAESPEVGEKLKKLQKKLQPIYAEYQKQKKAKEKYDKQFPALKQKHDALVKVGSYVPTFEPTLGDVAKQMAALAKDAKANDYVAALKAIPGLEKEIAKVTADASSAVKMMIEYETRLAGLAQRLADAADPTGHDEGEKLQASMKTIREEMQDSFDEGDYADALGSLDALEIDLTRFESVVGESRKHKDAYEKLVAEVEPAVKDALKQTVMNEGAQSTKEQLEEWFDDAQLKARDEEYFEALGSLEEARQYLGEFEVKVAALAEDKQKYDEQMGQLAARVDEILTSVKGGRLTKARETIQGHKDKCEEYAQAEDYASAMAEMSALEAQVLIAEAFGKELDEFEAKYQERLAELQPRIDAAFETVPDALQKRQTAITDKFRATEKLASDGSYAKALNELDAIAVLLAAFEVARTDSDEEKAQYDTRYADLKKRWAKAAKPLKNEDLLDTQDAFVESRANIEADADAGNYGEALTKMDLEEAGLTYFENALAKHEAAEKEYKSRLKALRRSLDRVATADAGTLMGVQTEIGEKETEAKSSADDGEYGDALATLDWLEPAVEGFLEQLGAGVGSRGEEADEADYKKRIKPFLDRKKKAFRQLERFSSERGDALKEQIDTGAAEAEEFADDDTYGQALASLFLAETNLTALENFLDQLLALRDIYDTRYAAIEPDLEKMRAPTKNEKVVKGQETVAEDVAEMEEFVSDSDYEQAIARLDELVLLIPAFLQYVADHEAERQEYETRLAALGDRLKEADHPVKGTEIEARQTEVKAARKRMEDAAKKDDFDTALQEMDVVEAELAALAQLAETQEESKAEYERRLPNATKLYKEIQAAVDSDDLEETQKEIAEVWNKMEESANEGDYPEATRCALSIEAFGPAFAAERRRHEDDKKDFEKRFKPLKARADEVLAEISTTSEIVEGDTEIPKVLGDVDDLVGKGDYTAALGKLAKLEAEISAGEREVKELLGYKKAVDERLPAVRKGVKKAAEPSDEDSVIEVQDKITELDDALKAELSEEKWAAALDTIKALETELKVLDIVLQQAARIAAADGDGGGGAQDSQGAAQNPFE